MTLSTQEQIDVFVKKFETLKFVFGDDNFEKVLAEAAEPAQSAMRDAAPESGYSHVMKDGGGSSKRVKSGNLKRSIQVFKSKKAKRNVSALVGPVTSKNSKITSLVGGPKVSRAKRAFYWRFNYYGAYNAAPNRFIDKSRNSSANAVLSKLKSGARKYLDKEIAKIF